MKEQIFQEYCNRVRKLERRVEALEERDELLDKVRNYINHIRNTGMGKKKSLEFIEKYIDGLKAESMKTEKDVSESMDEIKKLPPVTPTRKKSKWTNGDPICPCCGENKFKDLDADIWADWKPKFCPNCGEKMESEE